MAKEASQPKAVNILRPSGMSRSASVHSTSSLTPSYVSQSSVTTRKPKISMAKIQEPIKPSINLYHPTRPYKSSVVSDYQPRSHPSFPIKESRPQIEIYKPIKRQTSSQQLKPEQVHHQPQVANLRSVLGPITAPVTTIRRYSNEHQERDPSPEAIDSSHNKSTLLGSSDDEYEDDLKDSPKEESDEYSDEEIEKDDSEEEPVMSEARVNRKIADLEIANQSFMAVNAMLEATVRKQASQVAQLKKQLKLNQANGEDIGLPAEPPKQELADLEEEWEKDEVFQRLCHLTDQMLERAQAAVVFEFKGLGRVITHYEDKDQADIPEYEQVDNDVSEPPETPVVDKPCTDQPQIDIPPIVLTETPAVKPRPTDSFHKDALHPRKPHSSPLLTLSSAPTKKKIPTLRRGTLK
ncbi:hypothetical protein CLU79DRAFT_780586 [Phycomyces nitens]|nr:hypothetical protein CLU79DRAFT_780586 [Phycomyces nitens]